jgi:hypothetical protein
MSVLGRVTENTNSSSAVLPGEFEGDDVREKMRSQAGIKTGAGERGGEKRLTGHAQHPLRSAN